MRTIETCEYVKALYTLKLPKIKKPNFATDTEKGGKVCTVLPMKATVLTRTTERERRFAQYYQ